MPTRRGLRALAALVPVAAALWLLLVPFGSTSAACGSVVEPRHLDRSLQADERTCRGSSYDERLTVAGILLFGAATGAGLRAARRKDDQARAWADRGAGFLAPRRP